MQEVIRLIVTAYSYERYIMNEYSITEPNGNKGNTVTPNKPPKSKLRQVIDTIVYFFIVFFVVILIQRFIIQPVEVDGASMEPTLYNADHVLLEKVSYLFSNPKRFDVIVFRPEEDKDLYYIKRVIGLPGERVRIEDSIIYINGEPLLENYGLENVIYDPGIAAIEITLGEEEYFVLGDNRNRSKDSRNSSVGKVKKESILGRAWFTIWPINDFGTVKH